MVAVRTSVLLTNTYKADIDDLVEAIRLLLSNYTDSMDYDVEEVLRRRKAPCRSVKDCQGARPSP